MVSLPITDRAQQINVNPAEVERVETRTSIPGLISAFTEYTTNMLKVLDDQQATLNAKSTSYDMDSYFGTCFNTFKYCDLYLRSPDTMTSRTRAKG